MPAYIVVGLGYGDEGKGTVVDHLVRAKSADGVVRFNGGAQAAHNVVLPDGRHHTFNQFGSGTFVPGVKTLLSSFMLVNPHLIFIEAERLQEVSVYDALKRLMIDRKALITTPFHIAANRLKEMQRGRNRHGSCGLGIGETQNDANNGFELLAEDLLDYKTLPGKLREIQTRKRNEMKDYIRILPGAWAHNEARALTDESVLADAVEVYRILAKLVPIKDLPISEWASEKTLVFEGAQGVLLDEWRGFHPYTTWSKTATGNALALIGDMGHEIHRIGVVRTYMTRHGAGPFVTESPLVNFPEGHNAHGPWQGIWRQGWTDLPALRYAIEACHVDELAVTHIDQTDAAKEWYVCTNYRSMVTPIHSRELLNITPPQERDPIRQEIITEKLMNARPELELVEGGEVPDLIANAVGVPISIKSYGPTYKDKRNARAEISV